MSAGLTAYFAYAILTLGLAKASGNDTIEGASAGLISLGAGLITMVVALAVNDWLARRYPKVPGATGPDRGPAPEPDRTPDRDSVSD